LATEISHPTVPVLFPVAVIILIGKKISTASILGRWMRGSISCPSRFDFAAFSRLTDKAAELVNGSQCIQNTNTALAAIS